MTADPEPTFSLAYSELEHGLAELCGVELEMVRVRFRKLRVRDFPDAVQLGRGVRLRYDLPRVLAFGAVFALAGAGLPQLTASDLVTATWPEWCRALIAAAVEEGIVPFPSGMPAGLSSELVIIPDAFSSCRELPIAVNGRIDVPPASPASCLLSMDARPIVWMLASGKGDGEALATAITDLDKSFGWTFPEPSFRANVSEMPPRRGFLDDGPYFERALAFLDACDGAPTNAVTLWRLGLYHSYLENPAPLDAWKREVGDDEVRPRLHHLLSFIAEANGVPNGTTYPHTIKGIAEIEASRVARDMIAKAQRLRGLSVG